MTVAALKLAERKYGVLPKWTPGGWTTGPAPFDVDPATNPPDKSPYYRLAWACGSPDAYRLEAFLERSDIPKRIGDYVQIDPPAQGSLEPNNALVRQIVSGVAAGWFLVEDCHCIAFLASVAPAINQAQALLEHAASLDKHAAGLKHIANSFTDAIRDTSISRREIEHAVDRRLATRDKQADAALHANIANIVDRRLEEFTKPAPPPKPPPQPKPADKAITRDKVSTRTWHAMIDLHDEGRLPDFKPSSIRSIQQLEWLRVPNFGRKSLAELVLLCGEW